MPWHKCTRFVLMPTLGVLPGDECWERRRLVFLVRLDPRSVALEPHHQRTEAAEEHAEQKCGCVDLAGYQSIAQSVDADSYGGDADQDPRDLQRIQRTTSNITGTMLNRQVSRDQSLKYIAMSTMMDVTAMLSPPLSIEMSWDLRYSYSMEYLLSSTSSLSA